MQCALNWHFRTLLFYKCPFSMLRSGCANGFWLTFNYASPAILGGFDSALESRHRTQLLAALSTYRDSDGLGMIPMEGGWICVGIGIKDRILRLFHRSWKA